MILKTFITFECRKLVIHSYEKIHGCELSMDGKKIEIKTVSSLIIIVIVKGNVLTHHQRKIPYSFCIQC